ncbi:AlpA family transcriptional regulator [Rhizobium mongolense USDA 1844]|uniref:AlpA family transcriptional regulator n=1 Tax=Rhizobium mongolense USDA 1844 TaxID=1079460 RepID=A0A559SNK9_9HYPH|nr:AlpA family phage regulatory protein [Rhizobium mongolense]TVZ63943.1 AlpA family transcriptional regulator [Rhizobium mongolense USDA 1844]
MTKTKSEFASPLMSPKEAAAVTTMSRPLLRLMSIEGKFPKPRQIGQRRIAYVRAEVESWVASKVSA